MHSGGATGSLAAGVTLTDTAFLSFSSESFTPGNQLSFALNLSSADDAFSLPDRFSFYIVDTAGSPIPTLAPSGDTLLAVDLTSANPAPQTWNTSSVRFPAASPGKLLPLSITAITGVTPAYDGMSSQSTGIVDFNIRERPGGEYLQLE